MGVKKKAVDLKTKAAVDEMRSFLAAGQSAQAAMEEFEDPCANYQIVGPRKG